MIARLAGVLALLAVGCGARPPVTTPRGAPAKPDASAVEAAAKGPEAEDGARSAPCTEIAHEAAALADRGNRAGAQTRLLAACDSGVPSCCHEAALEHRKEITGYLVHSPFRAAQLFQHACEHGYGPSCRELGRADLLDRACLLGDAIACAEWKGPALLGLALHARGCELGDRSACKQHAAALAPLAAVGALEFWSTRDPRFDGLRGTWGKAEVNPFAFTASGRYVFAETGVGSRIVVLDARTGRVAARPRYDPERLEPPAYFTKHRVGSHLFFFADMWPNNDAVQPTDWGTFLRRVGRDGDTGWQRLKRGAFQVEVPTAFSWDGRIAAGKVSRGSTGDRCPFGREGVQRWDVATGEPLGEPVPLPAGVSMGEVRFDLSPDGQLLVVGGRGGTQMEVWRMGEAQPFATTPMEAGWVRISPDGIVSGQTYDHNHGPRRYTNLQLSTGQVSHVEDEAEGRSRYVSEADLLLFTGQVARFFDRLGKPLGDLEVGDPWLHTALSSPDGKTVLVSWLYEGTLRIQRDSTSAATATATATAKDHETAADDELAWFRELRMPLAAPESPPRPALRDCGEIAADGEVELRIQEVRGQKRRPWPNRTVELRPAPFDPPVRGLAEVPPRRGRTDGSGRLRFSGLQRIQWTAHALDAAGGDGSHVTGDRIDLSHRSHVEHEVSFWPRPRQQPTVPNVAGTTPGPGAAIVRLRFVDDQGKPLPAEEVRNRFGLATDPEGRALFTSCPNCTARCDSSMLLGSLQLEDAVVRILDDACEIRLPSASIRIDTKGVRYSPNLLLLESPHGLQPWQQPRNRKVTRTGFEWTDLPAGRYALKILHGFRGEHRQVIDLAPGQALEFDVPEMFATPVRGRIVDDATGLPLTGFSVMFDVSDCEIKSDAQGRFHFDHVIAGRNDFRIGPTRLETLHQQLLTVEYRVPMDLGTIRIRGVRAARAQ